MRRSAALTAASVLTATMLAAACGAPQEDEVAPATVDDGPPTDGFTAWAFTGGSEIVLRESFESWNSQHPDRRIDVGWMTNDEYKTAIDDALDSGDAPTLVVGWAGNDLDRYVADGAVADLTGRVDPVLDRALDSVAAQGQIDGRTYAVPNNQTQPVVLYHNAQVLEDVGIAPPETFAQLLDAVEQLRDAGVQPIALAGGSKWPELMYIQYLTDRIGGPEVFGRIAAGEPDAWSDPAVLEALHKIRDLVDAEAFGSRFTEVVADGAGDTSLVANGHAGFVLQGAWVYPDFVNENPQLILDGDLGYTTFPEVLGGAGDPENVVGNPANFWSVSASASPEEQQAAIDFLNEQNYAEHPVKWFLATRSIPPVKGLDSLVETSEDPEYARAVYDMVASAPHFQLSWDQALPPDQAGPLLDNLHQVFTGELTPQGFVDAMNATL